MPWATATVVVALPRPSSSVTEPLVGIAKVTDCWAVATPVEVLAGAVGPAGAETVGV